MANSNILKTLLIILLLTLSACSSDEDTAPTATKAPQITLRVIMPSDLQGLDYLPRSGLPDNEEYRLPVIGDMAAGWL